MRVENQDRGPRQTCWGEFLSWVPVRSLANTAGELPLLGMDVSLSMDGHKPFTELRVCPLLNSAVQHAADDWVMLAAQISHTPIALIGLWDNEHQWFLSSYGCMVQSVPSTDSPDVHSLSSDAAIWIVPNLQEAIATRQLPPTVARHPLLNPPFSLQFYAAVPLRTKEGRTIGALSVWDHMPRTLTPEHQQGLRAIARQLVTQLEPLCLPVLEDTETSELPLATQARLLDLASDAILALDLQGRITFWNRGAESLYGWNKSQALGQDYYALLQPVTERSLSEIQQQCFEEGRWEGWLVHSTHDCERIAISSHWTLQKTEQGQPGLVLQINTPIKNYCDLDSIVREELHHASEHAAELYNYLPDGFIALDQRWTVTQFNLRAEQILCCDRTQVLDRPLWEALPDLRHSLVEEECKRAIAQQVEIRFEHIYTAYGLVLEIIVRPHAGGLFMYLRDVTVHRKTVASLLEYTRLSHLNTEISQILSCAGTLNETLDDCVNAIVDGLEEVTLARIWLFDRETNILTLRAIAGEPLPVEDVPKRTSIGISIVGVIAQTQQPYLTNEVGRDVCLGLQEWAQQGRITAFVGYPLVVNDRLIGVVTLLSRDAIETGTYASLQWIFSSVAIAIDRSIARAELLSRRESLLFRLASQIRKSLDLDTILGAAVQEIRQLLKIDRCHFLWCAMDQSGEDNLPALSITHESAMSGLPSLLGNCEPNLGRSLVQSIVTLEPQRFDYNTATHCPDENVATWLENYDMQSLLIIPLETHAGQLGAIACSHQSPRIWTDTEVELLQAVSNQLAIAIDQAELFAQTRAAAAAAQAQAQQLSQALQTLRQTQAKMIQSEKMSSLGQLVAGIAHEINNPVGFVSGNLIYAETYFQDLVKLLRLYQTHYPTPPEEVQTCIHAIELDFLIEDYASLLASMKIGTNRICKIVQSLRNFSRLDEAEVKSVDIHDGLDNTLLILQNRLKARASTPAINIIKRYGQLPLIDCYASQLNQVFLNILSNAIDALETCPSPRTITITTQVRPPDATADISGVIIRIKDNGVGMSDQIRQKIFDPFFTTKPVGQGTGLGLSISHQIIVENHRGWLSCESQVGEGSEFIIELPLTLPIPDEGVDG